VSPKVPAADLAKVKRIEKQIANRQIKIKAEIKF
jgi:hypothetical protein